MGDGSVLSEIAGLAPGEASPVQVRKLLKRLPTEAAGQLTPHRLVILSSYTTDFLDPFLKLEGARHGLDLSIVRGGFGEFETALMNPAWGDAEVPETLWLQLRLEDLDLDAVARFYATGGERLGTRVDEVLGRIEQCITLHRRHNEAGAVLVANFAAPHPAPLGPFDASSPNSLTHALAAANRQLAERLGDKPACHVWDYAGLVASRGAAEWTDPRLWALARTAVASKQQPHLAAHLLRTLKGTTTAAAKCLVLDLDQTIWGGAVGDLGVEGIELSDDFPGSAFKNLQRAALGLRDRGILLAVASKNDESVVREAMNGHPEMLIRMQDLAAHRIHWGPKSQSLKEMAEELNIGIDSLVFFDDNPVERQEVRLNAPGVRVVEVPEDPVRYASCLLGLADFDAPRLTTEDLGRAQSYQAQKSRKAAEQSSGSMEEFLRSLEMTAEVGEMDAGTSARIAQLVGKTNQFNATTRRHSQAELTALSEAEGSVVCWLRLADRFGDMGLIGIGVLRREDDAAVIDSLVMSCRAANRSVEQAIVSLLQDKARELGATRLVGEFIPSPRNHVIAELYPKLGFAGADAQGDVQRFELDLDGEGVTWPDCIARGA